MTNDSSDLDTSDKKPIWLILFTILSFGVMAAMVAAPFSYKADAYPDIVRFLGRFHPMFLHMPIGFLVLVAIMESINILPFVKRKFETTFMLFAASVSSVIAIALGFLLMRGEGTQGELMNDHMWGGIAFGCVVIAAMLLKMWGTRGAAYRVFAPLCVFFACAVMSWAAHNGGALVHGKDYLTKYAPDWVPDPIYAALGDGSPRPVPVPEAEKPPPSEMPVFAHVITPILEEKCLYCHDADKQSGKLRMDTLDLMLKGGAEGPTLVVGDSEASLMMQRIHLPIDDPDEEHMPPANKTQLEDFEVKILDWWIDAGTPLDESIVALGAPEEIIESANLLISTEEREALEKKKEEEKAAAEQAAEERRANLASAMAHIQNNYPGALNFVSRETTDLTFTSVSMRDKFTDEDLSKLIPVAEALTNIDLGATSISDSGMAYIAEMKNLQVLKLSETAITDEAIPTLAELQKLQSLNLYGTQITDSGIKGLTPLQNLKRLYLWNSQVTTEGADALKTEMPNTEITLGVN